MMPCSWALLTVSYIAFHTSPMWSHSSKQWLNTSNTSGTHEPGPDFSVSLRGRTLASLHSQARKSKEDREMKD